MKNTMKYILGLLVVALAFGSCIKETFPTNSATADQIKESPIGLESGVNGLNGWLTKFNTLKYGQNEEEHFDFGYSSLCLWYEALGQDQTNKYSGFDVYAFVRNISSHAPEGLTTWYPWQYLYTQILMANSLIRTVGFEGLSDQQKTYIGQALVFRSMAYFDLARLYTYRGSQSGAFVGLSVPIITETTDAATAVNNPRAPEQKLYDELIIPDLKKAIEFLDGYTRPATKYVDKAVAYGFLARVYLQREQWGDAEKAAREAITASGCEPLSPEEYMDATTGFNNINSQNSWMWGTVMTTEDDAVQTGICNFISMASSEVLGTYSSYGVQKCMDRRLYESIQNSDFRKLLFKSPDKAVEPPTSYPLADKVPVYGSFKFRPGKGDFSDVSVACATDFPLMRVEEMYLIEAEAAGMQSANRGKELLENFVKSYRDPSYTCTASDSKGVQDAIFQQRRIEFWGEGITPFDFKRLNKPIVRGYKGTNHGSGFRYNSETGVPAWMTLCIPLKELENNAGITEAVNNPNATLLRGTLWQDSK